MRKLSHLVYEVNLYGISLPEPLVDIYPGNLYYYFLMNWYYKKILSLFLIFILGIGSLQIAIAASSPLSAQADGSCPMSQTMGDSTAEAISSHDCGQEKAQNNGCADFSCQDNVCVSGAVAAPAEFSKISLAGLSEKITGIENKIASNSPYLLFRPPRN